MALRLAYRGDAFAGWQRQRDRASVQGTLEDCLTRLYGAPVRVVGAGRTDAGVHAAGQVAHFDATRRIPPAGLVAALNAMLPPEVRVLQARLVPAWFHARRSAVAKVYHYRLAWGPPLTPWEAARTWELPAPLDLPPMRAAAELFPGTHDFASFASSGHSGTGARGTLRTLVEVRLLHRGRRLGVVVRGDGFLRAMVRRLTGALVEVGRGAQSPTWVAALLASAQTLPPAPTAPARGLTLERVVYPR
jgi:tRNA pseudouridine38-40 synthase